MSEQITECFYYPLFEHMSREHGLTLVDSELNEICHIARKLNAKADEQNAQQTSARMDAERAADLIFGLRDETGAIFRKAGTNPIAEIILRETNLEALQSRLESAEKANAEMRHALNVAGLAHEIIDGFGQDYIHKSELEKVQGAANAFNALHDKWGHLEEFKEIIAEFIDEKNYSAASMFNAWIAKILEDRSDLQSHNQSLEKRNAELEGELEGLAGYASTVRFDRKSECKEFCLQTEDWCNGLVEYADRATALLPDQSGKELADDAAAQLSEDKRAYESERMAGLRDIHQSGKEAV